MASTRDSWPRAEAGVREGDVLAGKYRVERVLGVGGMGVVVAAHHLQLDEKVAIKFLLPEALENPEAVARFAREARAAVKIKSEHVARVVDVGTLDGGAPFMVMEYLEGGDLGAWIQERGVLSVEQAVELILQTCEAVAEAHALGIIHRDLKPSNLVCTRRSDGVLSAKVLDFGISKVTGASSQGPGLGITRTTSVIGSPLYMSPEQMLASRDVDARTDIWALGVILYEMLTGATPFCGETFAELCVKISSQRPVPLHERRPDLPRELQAVILKCLEKNRDQRFANVAELAQALGPFGPRRSRPSVERISRIIQASGLSTSALTLPISSERERAEHTQQSWGGTQSASPSSRNRMVVGLAALLVMGSASWLWFSSKSHDAAQISEPTKAAMPPALASIPNPAASSTPEVAPAVLAVARPAATMADAGAPVARAKSAPNVRRPASRAQAAAVRHDDAFARPD